MDCRTGETIQKLNEQEIKNVMDDQLRTTIMDYFEQFTDMLPDHQEMHAEGLVDYLAERGYEIKVW